MSDMEKLEGEEDTECIHYKDGQCDVFKLPCKKFVYCDLPEDSSTAVFGSVLTVDPEYTSNLLKTLEDKPHNIHKKFHPVRDWQFKRFLKKLGKEQKNDRRRPNRQIQKDGH